MLLSSFLLGETNGCLLEKSHRMRFCLIGNIVLAPPRPGLSPLLAVTVS